MRVIGDGGHAAVVRDMLLQLSPTMTFPEWDCIVAVGDNANRRKEVDRIHGARFPAVVHPHAYKSPSAEIGEGTVVMAGAIVQARAKVGRHVILNTGCTVDHDCVIGDFAHIAPGVHLCGGVVVGEGALVGVGSCAVPGAVVKDWARIPAGSVLRVLEKEIKC